MRSIQLIYGRTQKGAHPAKPPPSLQGDFKFTPKSTRFAKRLRMVRRGLGLALAVDHFANKLDQAPGHTLEPLVPLLRRGQGGAPVGLIGESVGTDVLRELGHCNGCLKLLRVPRHVVRQPLAATQQLVCVRLTKRFPIGQKMQVRVAELPQELIPPCPLTTTMLRKPARAMLSIMSPSTVRKVPGRSVSVPGCRM